MSIDNYLLFLFNPFDLLKIVLLVALKVYLIYESETIWLVPDILLFIELFTKFPENKMLENIRASLEPIFNINLLK